MPLTLALLAALAAFTQPPPVVTVAGAAAPDLRGAVALFWRTDCGPCLVELADLRELRRAAAPLRVVPVALDITPGQPGPLAPALAKVGLEPADTLRAQGDPAALLTLYGGAPPRLPLAVAFDASGRVCGRRTGLLGYDRLKTWAAACGRADAPRR